MNEKVQKALALFDSGFYCSQAVIGAFCDQFDLDKQIAMKLASGFGGGLCCGEVCGAVAGAVIVIGLKYGFYNTEDKTSKQRCNKITSEFMKEYTNIKKTVICRELLGYDVRDTETKAKFPGRQKEVCPGAIETAVLLLEKMGF